MTPASQRFAAVVFATAVIFEFDIMRHKPAVVAHLNSDVLDCRNYAGQRGRLGVNEVDAG
jgi:hypothetical protein